MPDAPLSLWGKSWLPKPHPPLRSVFDLGTHSPCTQVKLQALSLRSTARVRGNAVPSQYRNEN